MQCIRHIQNSGIFRSPLIQVYSGIFKHTKVFLRHIQTYSGIFSTLHNTLIFTTLPYSKPWHLELEAYSKPCETLQRYIQNPVIVRAFYPSIIQPCSGKFRTLCHAYKCRNLTHFELWNIRNPSMIAYRHILRILSYLRKQVNHVQLQKFRTLTY